MWIKRWRICVLDETVTLGFDVMIMYIEYSLIETSTSIVVRFSV